MKIELINGSYIQICGSDSIDSLVGTNAQGIVYSEFALQDERAYQYLRPVLAANDGWVIFESTPRGKNHFWNLYNLAKNSTEYYLSHLTLDDTQHISVDEIEKDIQQGVMSRDMANQEYWTSFDLGVEGSYYSKYLNKMRLNGQISQVPWEPAFKVHVSYDLGMRDSCVLLFFQVIGQTVRIIDVEEHNGKGLEFYAKLLGEKEYSYGRHFFPHDVAVRELGTGMSRIEKLRSLGIKAEIAPNLPIVDGIEAVRSTLPKIWIDEKKGEKFIRAIDQYRKEYDNVKKIYKDHPLHDWSSDYADSLRYLCLCLPKTKNGMSAQDIENTYLSVKYGESNSFDNLFDKRFR
jgi:hypothetical protein